MSPPLYAALFPLESMIEIGKKTFCIAEESSPLADLRRER